MDFITKRISQILNLIYIAGLILLTNSNNCFAINPTFNAPVTQDTRIRNLIYNENDVYNLKFIVDYMARIEFAKDEIVETVTVGEPQPWKIIPFANKLFIKPLEPGVVTNMTVLTNRNAYDFQISSDYASEDNQENNLLFVARFFYPSIPPEIEKYSFQQYKDFATSSKELKNSNSSTSFTPINPISENSNLSNFVKSENLNYNYSIEGNQTDFTPIEVFDDTKNTYLKFSSNLNIPDFYKMSQNEQKEKISTTIRQDYVVIKGIYNSIIMEKGGEQNTLYRD
jgi:type IV secretion system protein VirB9